MKVDDAVEAFIRLRDHRDEMKRKHKEELAPITEKMDKIENWLQRELLRDGVESFKTAKGTAFLQSSNTATVKDWATTLEYIRAKGEWSLLEARVSKTAVRDFMESTGEVPPGVDYKETIVTRVRR